MKIRYVAPIVALLAITGPAAFAQSTGSTGPQQTSSTQQLSLIHI